MKISHLLLLLAVFSFASCGDDEGSAGDPNLLSYDGNNATAPDLAAGIHELAIYFPASAMKDRIGKKLHEVEVYVDQGADYYKIKVHGPGAATSPGPVIFEKDFTGQVDGRKWAIVSIDPPLDITGEDLWIAVEVFHSQTAQTIGCDSGPRKSGGDWIWSSNINKWQTFFERSSDEINWNIRGHLID